MQEASFYSKITDLKVQCLLCPRECIIDEGKFGDCHARRNRNGQLISEVFSKIAAIHTDPIEKKPLYHFFPGKKILSVGTTGCNMHCVFCQNHELSQCDYRRPVLKKKISPAELAKKVAKQNDSIGLAFTYNEPSINFEYLMDTARLVKRNNQFTVMVSNGYINSDPLAHLLEYFDAFNIDLKAFTNSFYQKYSKATLQPVLKSLKQIVKAGKHLEITNLIIPGGNSDEEEFEDMCDWISSELGSTTVLHISKYFPRYELNQYPTPAEMLFECYDIAKKYLKHVYLGNMATEIYSNTYCPKCEKKLIERTYYNIGLKGISKEGNCLNCGEKVIKYM